MIDNHLAGYTQHFENAANACIPGRSLQEKKLIVPDCSFNFSFVPEQLLQATAKAVADFQKRKIWTASMDGYNQQPCSRKGRSKKMDALAALPSMLLKTLDNWSRQGQISGECSSRAAEQVIDQEGVSIAESP